MMMMTEPVKCDNPQAEEVMVNYVFVEPAVPAKTMKRKRKSELGVVAAYEQAEPEVLVVTAPELELILKKLKTDTDTVPKRPSPRPRKSSNAKANVNANAKVKGEKLDRGQKKMDNGLKLNKTAERPQFQCEHCDYKNPHERNVKLHHIRRHTSHDQKPFQCTSPKCGKGFATNSDLRKHSQTHCNNKGSTTGIEPIDPIREGPIQFQNAVSVTTTQNPNPAASSPKEETPRPVPIPSVQFLVTLPAPNPSVEYLVGFPAPNPSAELLSPPPVPNPSVEAEVPPPPVKVFDFQDLGNFTFDDVVEAKLDEEVGLPSGLLKALDNFGQVDLDESGLFRQLPQDPNGGELREQNDAQLMNILDEILAQEGEVDLSDFDLDLENSGNDLAWMDAITKDLEAEAAKMNEKCD